MKKFLLLSVLILLPLVPACGQGYFSNATTVGLNNGVVALPGAKVTICAFPATGQTSSTPCTNTVTTFTDQTLSVATSPGACTFVTGGTSFCNPITADAQGNFGFWIPAGTYATSTCVGSYCAISSPITTPNPTGHAVMSSVFCSATSGSSTTYTCNTTPRFAPADGDIVDFDADVTNSGAITLNVNGSGAIAVNKWTLGSSSPVPLARGDIQANQPSWVYFDAGLNIWSEMSPTALSSTAMTFGCTGTATSSSTLFMPGLVDTSKTCTLTGNGGSIGVLTTSPGTLHNLQVLCGTGGVNASSGKFTVFMATSSTPITCTVGTNLTCSDTTHTAVVGNGGVTVQVQFTTQAAETLNGCAVVVQFN